MATIHSEITAQITRMITVSMILVASMIGTKITSTPASSSEPNNWPVRKSRTRVIWPIL